LIPSEVVVVPGVDLVIQRRMMTFHVWQPVPDLFVERLILSVNEQAFELESGFFYDHMETV
jgi:hypothetical protein